MTGGQCDRTTMIGIQFLLPMIDHHPALPSLLLITMDSDSRGLDLQSLGTPAFPKD
jgi:hypothetical protein